MKKPSPNFKTMLRVDVPQSRNGKHKKIVSMILSDWLINHEDVAFHAALTVVMSALAAAAWAGTSRVSARRRVNTAS